MLPVVETFVSIQGESTHAGRRCFFIRLAGCNLRCNYCDTQYAWDGGVLTPVDELVSIAMSSNTGLVEVTGGEPLIHEDAPLLMQKLLDSGMEVLLETNGSVSIAGVPEKVRKIVDCKTPGS
ncbi:MAG: radical SAM protein [Lentisphaeria bacterium]|nr:radical SAM protein [Lentisphaeria bacterium]